MPDPTVQPVEVDYTKEIAAMQGLYTVVNNVVLNLISAMDDGHLDSSERLALSMDALTIAPTILRVVQALRGDSRAKLKYVVQHTQLTLT